MIVLPISSAEMKKSLWQMENVLDRTLYCVVLWKEIKDIKCRCVKTVFRVRKIRFRRSRSALVRRLAHIIVKKLRALMQSQRCLLSPAGW